MALRKSLGAHHVIDRTRQDIVEEVKKIVPAGVDIVIDHVEAATWATSIATLRQAADGSIPARHQGTKRPSLFGCFTPSK